MKLLLLIPLIMLVTIPAYADNTARFSTPNAEVFENYDTMQGHAIIYNYDRLQTGPNSFVKFRTFDNPNDYTLESATVAAKFYDTGTVKLFKPGTILSGETPMVNSISHTIKEAVNGTDDWYEMPINDLGVIQTVKDTKKGPIITNTKGDWVTEYNTDFQGALKWTFKYTNNDNTKTNHKYGFTTVFSGDFIVHVNDKNYNTNLIRDTIRISAADLQNQKLEIRDSNGFKLIFDPQNEIHNYLWVIKIEHGKLILDFTYSKGVLPVGETLTIDPVIGWVNDIYAKQVQSVNQVSASCHTTANSNQTTESPAKGSSTANDNCKTIAYQFQVFTIPVGSAILDTRLKIDVDVIFGVAENMNINQMTLSNIVTATNQAVYDDSRNYLNGTVYSNNNANFTTVGNNKVADLGADADSDLASVLATNKLFKVGLFSTSQTRPVASWQVNLSDAQLYVTYNFYCTAPTNLQAKTATTARINLSWTAPTACTGLSAYRIYSESPTGAGFTTLVSNTGNTTVSYAVTGLNSGYQYNFKVAGINGTGAGTNSSTKANATLTNAPGVGNTEASSITSIIVRWLQPAIQSVGIITGYQIQFFNHTAPAGWQTAQNDTGTTTQNYNHTGLYPGHQYTYRVKTYDAGGSSAYSSNMTASTYEEIDGSTLVSVGVVGDVSRLNATISITDGVPDPLIQVLSFYDNGTLVGTKLVNETIARGDSFTFSDDVVWRQITDANVHSYTVRAFASNVVGVTTLNGSATNDSREYDPDYFTAIDPTQGLVNFTVTRSDDQDELNLKVNRDLGGATFQIECLYQDNSQAAFNGGGTWHNLTGTGFLNDTLTGVTDTHIYISCYNDGELFTTTSYTNSSLILFGIDIFDESYGSMLGVPVGIFFIAMAGSMANKRTAPTWIVVVLAMAGTMAAIGFFTINPLVWGLALVSGLLGIMVNQKIF